MFKGMVKAPVVVGGGVGAVDVGDGTCVVRFRDVVPCFGFAVVDTVVKLVLIMVDAEVVWFSERKICIKQVPRIFLDCSKTFVKEKTSKFY